LGQLICNPFAAAVACEIADDGMCARACDGILGQIRIGRKQGIFDDNPLQIEIEENRSDQVCCQVGLGVIESDFGFNPLHL
jgi:hypothetical protein